MGEQHMLSIRVISELRLLNHQQITLLLEAPVLQVGVR